MEQSDSQFKKTHKRNYHLLLVYTLSKLLKVLWKL